MRSYLDVLAKIEETGVRAWLVGDTVRMLFTGVQPDIITLAVDTDDMYSLMLALNTGAVDARGTYPALRGELFEIPFRAFALRGNTIEDDLACRDLSIEAIAIRSDGGVVDPFGGRFDIRNRVIRLTGDNVELIDADPLRILRMLRLSAELEMDIFWKTTGDVREFLDSHPDRMKSIPDERWGREILNGMRRRPYNFMKLCDDFNLIPFFLKGLSGLPDVSELKKNDRNLFDRVLKTLKIIQHKLDSNKIMQRDSFVLAGLFSYISLKKASEAERQKYVDRLINDCLTRWNIPSETITAVTAIINGYKHFYEPITEEKFCKKVLEFSTEAMEVALEFAKCVAEAEGFIDDVQDVLSDNEWNLNQVLRRFRNVSLETEGQSRYLTGREVMNLLNIKPGRRVGELLENLDFAVGTGKVTSRKGAEAWLKAQ